jgi:hypothetical protein
MSYRRPSIASALLCGAIEPIDSPLSAAVRVKFVALQELARLELIAAVAVDGPAETARRLGVARSTLWKWTRPEQPLPERLDGDARQRREL